MGFRIGHTYFSGRILYAVLFQPSSVGYFNTTSQVFETYSGVTPSYDIALTEDNAREYSANVTAVLNSDTYVVKVFEQVGSGPDIDVDLLLTCRSVPYSIDAELEVTEEMIYTTLVNYLLGSGSGSSSSASSEDTTNILKYVKAILSDLGRRKL